MKDKCNMLLENKYYRIEKVEADHLEGVFHLRLLPDCDVYRGHFPGSPACPGVCHIETIKECAMYLVGKRLSFTVIRQCRFPAMATPADCPEVEVTVSLCPADEGFKITARISDAAKTYAELKGWLTEWKRHEI